MTRIEKNLGHERIVLTTPNRYPTAQEVECYLNMLENFKANNYYIIPSGAKLEFFGCVECNLRNYIRQRQYYFNWFKKVIKNE